MVPTTVEAPVGHQGEHREVTIDIHCSWQAALLRELFVRDLTRIGV
jgi:hypothetical protein